MKTDRVHNDSLNMASQDDTIILSKQEVHRLRDELSAMAPRVETMKDDLERAVRDWEKNDTWSNVRRGATVGLMAAGAIGAVLTGGLLALAVPTVAAAGISMYERRAKQIVEQTFQEDFIDDKQRWLDSIKQLPAAKVFLTKGIRKMDCIILVRTQEQTGRSVDGRFEKIDFSVALTLSRVFVAFELPDNLLVRIIKDIINWFKGVRTDSDAERVRRVRETPCEFMERMGMQFRAVAEKLRGLEVEATGHVKRVIPDYVQLDWDITCKKADVMDPEAYFDTCFRVKITRKA